VERLAYIFEIFGPLHIISHERRRKQKTNRGLSAGLRCRVSCFPVWCDERRRQIVVCPPVYAAGLAISPRGAGKVVVHGHYENDFRSLLLRWNYFNSFSCSLVRDATSSIARLRISGFAEKNADNIIIIAIRNRSKKVVISFMMTMVDVVAL
jgi:hypothetical protein